MVEKTLGDVATYINGRAFKPQEWETSGRPKLKIYWSSETMQEVVAGFSIDTSRQKSLAIIKEKLKQDKNT